MFNGVKSSLCTHAGKAVIVPMTGRKPVMVTLLLRCSEQEFDETIRTMDPPVLFDSVTALQYEMSKEQRNFNTLSEELAMVSDKNSYQFRSISQDLIECQARLTILMNRSMKCFNQQKYIEANKSKSKKLPSPTRRTAKFYKVSPDSESLKSGDSQTSENHHHSSESKTSANQRVSAEIHTSGVFSTVPTNTDMRSESEQRLQANGYVIKQKVSESGETSGHSGHVIVDQRDSAHDSKSESIEIIENIPIDELKLHKASTSMKISISPTKEIKSDKLFYDGGDDKSKVLRESPEDSRSVKKLKSIFQQPEVERSKAETETRLKAELEPKSPVLQLLSEKTDRQSEQTAATSSSVLTKTPDSKSTSLTIGQLSIGNDTIEKSEQTLVTSSPKLVKSEKKKIPDVVEKRDNIKELKQRFESRVTFDSNVLGYNDSGIDTSGSRSDSGTMETSEEEPEWPLFNKDGEGPILGFEDENAIEYGADGSELVKARVHLKQWNPRLLLDELYRVKLMEEDGEDMSNSFIGMEGYMEKLPLGKRKSTLLKTWKRRYFKATDGWLHYYEYMVHQENPTMSMQLMGGKLEVLESRILGIDDSRGHYLMVRCPSEKEFKDWKLALDSQMLDNSSAVYIRPVLKSPPHPAKKVVIIDLGTASIRAGVLGKEASLPELFFPHIVAVDKSTGAKVVGKDAFKPEIRQKSMLVRPIQPSNKVDKFNIDSEMADALFEKIFKDLNLDCSKYWILLSTPMNLSDNLKQRLMDILIHKFSVLGVCMVQQALLAMYSYKATSGIIVDVGERIEVLPITQGYIVDGGVSKQAFGAQKVMESLNFSLTEKRYRLFTAAEALIVRYVMEKSCYVSDRYAEEKRIFKKDPQKYLNNILLKDYELPPLTYESIEHDISTFKSAEGLFNPDLWGMDYPTLHKLVHRAIQAAPMDSRREICRSIYLSGGLTRLPGFAERLQMEVKNLVPSTLTIQVHAAPQRYHAAYIGACTLAAQDVFQQSCIDRKEWKEKGIHSLQKWHMPS